jgi:hypothetical protein
MLPKRQLPSEPRSVPIAEFREFPRINLLEWMNDYSAHQRQLLPNRSGAALERMWLHEVFRGINRRQKMKRLAVTTALATVFASYAFAQATTEYYVAGYNDQEMHNRRQQTHDDDGDPSRPGRFQDTSGSRNWHENDQGVRD